MISRNDFLLKWTSLGTVNIGNAKYSWDWKSPATAPGLALKAFDLAPVTINLRAPLPLAAHSDCLLARRLSAAQHKIQATGCTTDTNQTGSQRKSFRHFYQISPWHIFWPRSSWIQMAFDNRRDGSGSQLCSTWCHEAAKWSLDTPTFPCHVLYLELAQALEWGKPQDLLRSEWVCCLLFSECLSEPCPDLYFSMRTQALGRSSIIQCWGSKYALLL